MTTLHPIAAAVRALAGHLADALPGVAVTEGWPEAPVEPDLPELTVVRVGTPAYDLHAPAEAHFANGLATYRYGRLTFSAQLDLWAAYRARRDELAYQVEAALNPGLPHSTGLWLLSGDYHGRPLSFDLTEGEPMDDGSSAPDGLWRHRWSLQCTSDLVVVVPVPALGHVDVKLLADEAGRYIVDLHS